LQVVHAIDYALLVHPVVLHFKDVDSNEALNHILFELSCKLLSWSTASADYLFFRCQARRAKNRCAGSQQARRAEAAGG